MSKKKGFGKFLAGALVGLGLGFLFAPKKGSETRQDLKRAINDFLEELKNIDVDEVRENIEAKILKLKRLEDLDKEKVMKLQTKSRKVQDMAEELVSILWKRNILKV